MNSVYLYIEIILLIEIGIVLFFIASIYVYALFEFLRKKRIDSFLSRINSHIHLLMQGSSADHLTIHKKLKRLDLWLEAIFATDQKFTTPQWEKTRYLILSEILNPLARQQTKKRRWLKRLFASQIFSLHASAFDEIAVATLISDAKPIIVVYAIIAATKIGTCSILQTAALRISQERRLTRNLFLNAFNACHVNIEKAIKNLLKSESNIFLLTTYYEILSRCPTTEPYQQFEKNLHSDNIDLKIAVIRYLYHALKTDSESILMTLVEDPSWQVRAVVVRFLGELKSYLSLQQLEKALRDKEWWVRINAAQALYQLDEPGIEVLKNQSVAQDRFAYETANFVLLSS